jgi:hypothetical protein
MLQRRTSKERNEGVGIMNRKITPKNAAVKGELIMKCSEIIRFAVGSVFQREGAIVHTKKGGRNA